MRDGLVAVLSERTRKAEPRSNSLRQFWPTFINHNSKTRSANSRMSNIIGENAIVSGITTFEGPLGREIWIGSHFHFTSLKICVNLVLLYGQVALAFVLSFVRMPLFCGQYILGQLSQENHGPITPFSDCSSIHPQIARHLVLGWHFINFLQGALD